MELLEQEKREFVRILIGKAETGKSGLRKPIKTINVKGEDPEKIYEELKEIIKNKK